MSSLPQLLFFGAFLETSFQGHKLLLISQMFIESARDWTGTGDKRVEGCDCRCWGTCKLTRREAGKQVSRLEARQRSGGNAVAEMDWGERNESRSCREIQIVEPVNAVGIYHYFCVPSV